MKRTIKIISTVMVCILIIATLTACNAQQNANNEASNTTTPEATTETQKDDKIVIGASTQTLQLAVYQVMKEKGQAKAKELGAELLWQGCEYKPDVQLNQVENYISQGIDVLVLEPAESNSAEKVVEIAKAAGIPIINLEAKIVGQDTDLRIVADSYKVGQMQVEQFVKDWGDKPANVVVCSGTKGDEVAEQITQGTLDTLAKYPQYKVVAHQWHTNWDRALAMNTMENALAKFNNDIQVVFNNNDAMGLGAYKAAENNKVADKILFYLADFDQDTAEIMLSGATNIKTVDKSAGLQGERCVIAAIKLAKGEKPDYDAMDGNIPVWYTPITMVDQNNLKDMCKIKFPDLVK